jgi:exopolysaccharide biosynthesis protein
MKTKFFIISILLAINAYPQIKIQESSIDNGIVYKKVINTIDTLSIDILKIDLSTNDFELRTVKANNLLNSKETTSKMVKTLTDSGYNVLAAINADFFEADGEIINNMISDGSFVKAVKFTDSPFNPFVNTQFAITDDNNILLEQFVFSGQLVLPNGISESINRINSKADSNSVTLYNSFQGGFTPTTKDNWIVSEISLEVFRQNLDTLFCVASDSFRVGGNLNINSDFILSANNKFARYLEREIKTGDTLKIILRMNPNYSNINQLVGGWPRLVKDGLNLMKINDTAEGDLPRFSKVKHPRTGIGFSKDSTLIYFITVDGRQESSSGMTLIEFADLMIEEGIFQGLNLDGGGSTTMVINNKIVNNPSDITGERQVGNCIMLIRKQKE